MTEEERKALRERQNANLKSFKPKEERTEEETKRLIELSSKGGKKRQEQIARNKTMQDVARELLFAKLKRDKAVAILGEDAKNLDDSQLDVMTVLVARIIQEVEQGNYKAFESIRDTAGYAPIKQTSVDLAADVITASDRELIENVRKRLEKAE